MQAGLRGGRQIIEREVPVGNAVETVRRRAVEAERIGSPFAVDREASSRERCTAQRTLVHPHPRVREARDVAPEHLVIGHEVMTQRHRLRDLQVREARHHGFGMLFGTLDEHALQSADPVDRLVRGVANPQPEIGCDLVVARPRGVQPSRRGADEFAQPVLDGHVDVLELEPLGHPVALIFGANLVEAFEDRRGIALRDDALIAEHGRMGFRGRNILAPQSFVEADRGVDSHHQLVRLRLEAPAPGPLGIVLVGHRRAVPRMGKRVKRVKRLDSLRFAAHQIGTAAIAPKKLIFLSFVKSRTSCAGRSGGFPDGLLRSLGQNSSGSGVSYRKSAAIKLLGVEVPEALADALRQCRQHFVAAAWFSLLINILYLAPTLYMLQVYDRVVPTGGKTTLLFVTIALALALLSMCGLDMVRARLLVRASERVDAILAPRLLDQMMAADTAGTAQAMRDFDSIRQTIGTPIIAAMFDAPWTPVFLLVAFMLHFWIGIMAIISAIILATLAWLNQKATRSRMDVATTAMAAAHNSEQAAAVNAATVRGLGMIDAMVARQLDKRRIALSNMVEAQMVGSRLTATSKFFRMFVQSAALGLGALLAIAGDISAGAIIAASILLSRALAPIESIIGGWPSIMTARSAIRRLSGVLENLADQRIHTTLPAPKGLLEVEGAGVRGSDGRPILVGISFRAQPGKILGIIGPNGSGKSTLGRVLVGAVVPALGAVRIDGARLGRLGSNRAWPPYRLHAAGAVAVRGHDQGEYLPLRRARQRRGGEGSRRSGDRGRDGGRRPRNDPAAAAGLRDPPRSHGLWAFARSGAANCAGASPLWLAYSSRPRRAECVPRHGR